MPEKRGVRWQIERRCETRENARAQGLAKSSERKKKTCDKLRKLTLFALGSEPVLAYIGALDTLVPHAALVRCLARSFCMPVGINTTLQS